MKGAARKPRVLVLFHAGKRMRPRDPRPCAHDLHIGPLRRMSCWIDSPLGTCARCGALIAPSQLRRTIN